MQHQEALFQASYRKKNNIPYNVYTGECPLRPSVCLFQFAGPTTGPIAPNIYMSFSFSKGASNRRPSPLGRNYFVRIILKNGQERIKMALEKKFTI